MLQVCYGQRQLTAFLSVFSFNLLTLSEKCIKYSPAGCAQLGVAHRHLTAGSQLATFILRAFCKVQLFTLVVEKGVEQFLVVPWRKEKSKVLISESHNLVSTLSVITKNI